VISLAMHPALPFATVALASLVLGLRVQRIAMLLASALALWMLAVLPEGAYAAVTLHGHDWVLLSLDGLSRAFAIAFAAYGGIAAVFAWSDDERGSVRAQAGLVAGGLLVVLAGDLLTVFVGWEWLTVASLFLVWQGRAPESWGAGLRYVALHFVGATLFLSGILLRAPVAGTGLEGLADGSTASTLIMLGVLVNAAMPPLHAWLPDAYPRASIFGSVFLAAFTTKAAVYVLARGFAGAEVLVVVGTGMTLVGVTFALLQDEMRRLLAYHIISQVGYMVAGVGLGTALALNGTTSHAVAHIFYKGLLLMGAGAVLHATGHERLSKLGALGPRLRLVALLTLVGAASISGVPLLNGFVSKSMIVSAAGYADRNVIAALLHLAAAGTFLSVGLKLPWFAFAGPARGADVERDVPPSMLLAMALAAAVCIVTGLVPSATLYALLPFDATYAPFTLSHFVESAVLLGITALVFWFGRRWLAPSAKDVPDVDRLYRAPIAALVNGLGRVAEGLGRRSGWSTEVGFAVLWRRLERYGEGHRNPTVAVQTTAIVAVLVALAIVAGITARG
jgi:multicomponent Na+:H+ antiporter subunit D